MLLASPAGTVLDGRLFRPIPLLGEGPIAPGQRLPSWLLNLVRRQWNRRPEADVVFSRLGSAVVLARAQVQEAEVPQVLVTLVNVTGQPEDRGDHDSRERSLAAERRHLARELHDVVAQRLATAVVHMECDLREGQSNAQRIEFYRDELRTILSAVRAVHQELRLTPVDARGLVAGLRQQVVPQLHRARCEARLVSRNWPATLAPDSAYHVLRLVQEATANVVRHAQASRAVIRLDGEAGCGLVAVTDNGVGFRKDWKGEPRSGGLSGMQERARLVGGRLGVLSSPGLGTTVSVVVPAHA